MKFSKSWKVNSGRSSRGTYSFITFSKFNLQPGFVPSLFFNDQWNHSQPCGLRLQSCANWTWFRHLILFSSSEFCLGNILMKPPDTVWMLRGLSPRFYELEEESSSPSGQWSNDTGDLSPRSWTWWSFVWWPLCPCWSCCFFVDHVDRGDDLVGDVPCGNHLVGRVEICRERHDQNCVKFLPAL